MLLVRIMPLSRAEDDE